MKRIFTYVITAILALSMLTACEAKKLLILTTNYPVYYLVKQIAQDKVDVASLSDDSGVPQRAKIVSVDPETNEETSAYYQSLLDKADLILTLGELEPYMTIYGKEINESSATRIDLSSVVSMNDFKRFTLINTSDNSTLMYPSAYYDSSLFDKVDMYSKDPVVWIEPTQMASMGREILAWLVKYYPEEKDLFNANFDTLYTNLTNLDYEFSSFRLQNKSVSFVSMTPSFGNWQKTYNVNVYPVVLSKYGVLPSQEQLDVIKRRILTEGVKYIVYEDNLPSDYLALYNQLKTELDLTEIKISNLYRLSQDDEDGLRDYMSIMNANLIALETIAE